MTAEKIEIKTVKDGKYQVVINNIEIKLAENKEEALDSVKKYLEKSNPDGVSNIIFNIDYAIEEFVAAGEKVNFFVWLNRSGCDHYFCICNVKQMKS